MSTIVRKLFRAITNPEIRFNYLSSAGFYNHVSDEMFLKKKFELKMGYPLDLENPKTFNEKLQWLKIYDRRPEYTMMVDKYESKNYVASLIGEEYIIPTIGVWDRFEDIEFDELPNQFVLKCTHDSGGVFIVRDKNSMDKEAIRKRIKHLMNQNYYYHGREWPYKNVKPRLIIEEYLESLESNALKEYKIFCFNGEPKLFLVCKGAAHGAGRTNDFYDLDFQHIPLCATYPNASQLESKPDVYEKLIEIAKKVSKGIPQLRVDTYVVDGKIYVGETTFYHDSGFCRLKPEKYDYEFGKLIELPKKGK